MKKLLILFIIINFTTTINSQSAIEYFNKGITNTKSKNFIKAIENFDKVIELDSSFTNAYLFRGMNK